MSPFIFDPLPRAVSWTGRYHRIAGKESVFHATAAGSVQAHWKPSNTGEVLISRIVDQSAEKKMAGAINHVKVVYAGSPGGSFQINEYGQVICPISGSSSRYWVGNVSGVPSFADPRTPGSTFELALPPDTEPGTPWERPYIGMRFNFDTAGSIYFQKDDGDVKLRIRLATTTPDLVRRFRQVRGGGSTIRFVVNLHGAVLTKQESDWQPVFVGFIDPASWFPREP